MSSTSRIALRGADKFILALENHDRHQGTSGNTCRYLLDLEGHISADTLKAVLKENEIANWLSAFHLSGQLSNSNYWKQGEPKEIVVTEIDSDTLIPDELLNRKQDRFDSPLLYFHVLHRSAGHTTIVLSWHHLLMDGYGATLFLRYLTNPSPPKPVESERSPLTWKRFLEMRKAKRYITNSSKAPIAGLEDQFETNVDQEIRLLPFSEMETIQIGEHVKQYGAKYGQGSYLLTCTARSVHNHLIRKGCTENDFWIPVPQDNRKKGATWPLIGNHLSFLFYRIDASTLSDKKVCITSLNKQMMEQIKQGIPLAYGHLMNNLRRIPTSVYSRLIKGTNRKSISSYLFTIAAEYPKEMRRFLDRPILNAISIPPNTYPPGLTFAINRFEGKLQIVVLFYKHLFSEDEMDRLLEELRKDLLN